MCSACVFGSARYPSALPTSCHQPALLPGILMRWDLKAPSYTHSPCSSPKRSEGGWTERIQPTVSHEAVCHMRKRRGAECARLSGIRLELKKIDVLALYVTDVYELFTLPAFQIVCQANDLSSFIFIWYFIVFFFKAL